MAIFRLQTPLSRHVLLVRLDNIGDYLIWAGQFSALRNKYPFGVFHLTLVGNKAWIELAEQSKVFDRVMPLDPQQFIRSFICRMRMAREVRRGNFGIAINPTYSRGFFWDDSIVRLSGAPERVGFRGDDGGSFLKRISDRWYTHLIEGGSIPLSEIERNVAFMRGLGVASVPALVNLPVNPQCVPEGVKRWEYFVLFPGASKNIRQWPAERFAEIATKIQSSSDLKAVVCGSAKEFAVCQEICMLLGAHAINLCGKTSLSELVSVIGNAKLLVTNETSASHIGPAVGTATVCVLGGGHFGRFLPYQDLTDAVRMRVVCHPMDCFGCNWECRYPVERGRPAPCIATINVGDVWIGVKELLDLH